MKLRVLFILILSFFLVSCSLALEEDNRETDNKNSIVNKNGEFIGIHLYIGEITEENKHKLYFGIHGVEDSNIFMNKHYSSDVMKDLNTQTIMSNVYLNREANKIVTIIPVYLKDNKFIEVSNGASYDSKLDFSHSVSEKVTLFNKANERKIQLNFVMIDTLQSIRFREFDKDYNLLEEKDIDSNLKKYIYNSNTDYIIVTETYKSGVEEYRKRKIIDINTTKYYALLFTNFDGVIETSILELEKEVVV